ncbi:NACHT domain-containing protein [Ideonella sp. A 288]|uniref:NACHT domain-containing protein n=1 Tax=Ideonella sp. A 288 TaxID=1962181 RepID=UPI0013034BF5|nr:NACHT domain-containing protein [Ideonella sp. A 288]
MFVSYSRGSSDLCKTVVEFVEGALNLTVFQDVANIHPGVRWNEAIERELLADRRPTVLLLATRPAVEHPEYIVGELVIALRTGLHIVPLEADPGCARPLLEMAIRGSGSLPERVRVHPQVLAVHDFNANRARLEDGLRLGLLGPRLVELLARRSGDYAAWRAHLARTHSFWVDATSPHAETLEADGGLVLIGPAGAGKSSLAAHVVDRLVADALHAPTRSTSGHPLLLRPLLLRESDLRDRGDSLARELGARSIDELQAHLEGCRESFGVQLLFIVDGLDQMAPDVGQTFRGYAEALARLSRVASTLVTCRREVWDEAYRRDVSLSRHDIEQLSPETVQRALEAKFGGRAFQMNTLLLRRALFLDLLLTHGERWSSVPDDDLGFLQQLWRDLAGEQSVPSRGGRVSHRPALIAMAKAQLELFRFDVPWSMLAVSQTNNVVAAFESLIEARILRRVDDGRVRFSHDLLDAFSMAEGLLAAPHQFDKLVEALAEDGMWSVAATYAGIARHRAPEHARVLFERFLGVLDDKPMGDLAMARAWAVTYALQERFEDFLPFILECFETDELLSPGAPAPKSRLAPPRLTQAAASTLASAFLALRRGRAFDAARVLPRLKGKLYTWRLRFRVVDAIAKFDAPEARDALLGFAGWQRRALAAREEVYDERALVASLSALAGYDHGDVRALLRSVERDDALHPRVRRAAQQSLGLGHSTLAEPLELTDDELVEDLRPFEPDRDHPGHDRYTDWRGVEAAAKAIELRIRKNGGQPSARVVAALIRALVHDQTAVRCTVAECLALVDSSDAGVALVAELGEADVPPQVRGACISALARILQRTSGVRLHALRLDAARAAVVARRLGRNRAAEALWALATGHEAAGDWPILAGGAALTPIGAKDFHVIESVSGAAPPVDWAGTLLHANELAAAGPELEAKFRYTGVHANGDALTLAVERSNWPVARTFHVVAREAPERLLPRFPTASLLPRPFGGAAAPGIACVHVVVRTLDGRVLLARRSSKAGYWPGAWSISFEEQVTARANGTPEDVVSAALRGFEEEFGLTIDARAATVKGALLELDTLNVAVVVRLDVPHRSAEIHTRWSTEPRPRHHHEAAALEFVDDERARIAELVAGRSEREPLHPTSRLRLAMAGLGDGSHDLLAPTEN